MKALKITWMGQSRRNALGLVEVEQDVKVPLLVLDIAVELADILDGENLLPVVRVSKGCQGSTPCARPDVELVERP